ncbi:MULTISPECIES: hypothetical protein [unclassified Geodermatophilus]|uniref:hypothetical protein n=1 Tax=unclassified Geodermatophilus TaxID=2637632 RepID=UPI003EE8E28C
MRGSAAPEGRAPEDEVRVGCRLLLIAFTGLTLLAVLGLLVGASRAHDDFAWRISTELTAAFLGAAFAAGFVLSLLSLRERRWSRIRVPVLTVTVYTVLALVATIVHNHGLQLFAVGASARFAAWFWLVVYLVVPGACLAVVLGHELRRGPAEPVHRPMPAWLVVLLAVQGATMAGVGVVLYLGGATVHHTLDDMTGFWPWELGTLSGQVVGSWLMAFGVAAALTIRERDLTRLVIPAVAYAVFGVLELLVLLRYRTEVSADDPWLWVYVAVLLTVVGSGGYGWWAGRRRADDRLVVPTRPGQATEDRSPVRP